MTSSQLIENIHQYCVDNTNEANIKKYSYYFKGDLYDGYGLSAALIYDKTKELLKTHPIDLQTAIDSTSYVIQHGRSEEISIAMQVVRGLHKSYTRDAFGQIENWFTLGINNWAHADSLATQIIPLFVNKKIVDVPDFKKWLSAPNKFQRRSAPVSFIKLLKTYDNFTGLFHFVECLMTDPEREVHQGMGWFLREAWKRKPAETEVFLMKWKDTCPRLIIQYATEKMTPEAKMNFRRKK
jgi:3-methyladenine DNA glycosylase AlkD